MWLLNMLIVYAKYLFLDKIPDLTANLTHMNRTYHSTYRQGTPISTLVQPSVSFLPLCHHAYKSNESLELINTDNKDVIATTTEEVNKEHDLKWPSTPPVVLHNVTGRYRCALQNHSLSSHTYILTVVGRL